MKIGVERVEALEANNATVKWTREALIDIIDVYKRKVKELKQQKTSRFVPVVMGDVLKSEE